MRTINLKINVAIKKLFFLLQNFLFLCFKIYSSKKLEFFKKNFYVFNFPLFFLTFFIATFNAIRQL